MDNLTKEERKTQRKEEWKEQLQKEERKKMMTKIACIVGGMIAVILAFWAIINFSGTAAKPKKMIEKIPSVTKADIQTGPMNAKVTLIEYADFQCPGCATYHPLVKKLSEEFKGKVNIVFRPFPLQSHQNAFPSAISAVAAHKQNKFREMENTLFENQSKWSGEENPKKTFDLYAEKIGLDMAKFHKDSADPKTKQFITDLQEAGLAAGVNSTPTFFINGKQIENPQTYETFKEVMQQALSQ